MAGTQKIHIRAFSNTQNMQQMHKNDGLGDRQHYFPLLCNYIQDTTPFCDSQILLRVWEKF